MKKRLLFLCMACLLFVGGCGEDTTPKATSNSTSASVSNSQMSASEIITAPTTPSASEHTTISTTSSVSTSATTQTTSHNTISTPSSEVQHTTLTGQTSTTTNVTAPPSTTTSTTTSTSTATTTRPNVIFTATVRNDKGQPVSGVTVSVWTSADVLIGHSVTGNNGVARITLENKLSSYRVKLSNIPTEYEADAEYRFSTNTVNITLRKATIRNEKDHSEAHYEEGQTMMNFSLTDIDGDTYQLSSLLSQKQLVVLDFWYTTCEPCKSEFPYFEKATQKFGDAFALLAINPINDDGAIRTLRQQLNTSSNTAVTFPMMRDTCNLALGFEVSAYPTTVFIDPNGIILDIHVGTYANEAEFFKAIERYLH